MQISGWLAGKKTYLVAGLLAVVVGALIFLGRLTPETGMSVALFALSLFAATFRSALAAHQAQVLALLEDLALAGVAARQGNKKTMLAIGAQAAVEGLELAKEMQVDKVTVEASAR